MEPRLHHTSILISSSSHIGNPSSQLFLNFPKNQYQTRLIGNFLLDLSMHLYNIGMMEFEYFNYLINLMRVKTQSKSVIKSSLSIESEASIVSQSQQQTDFQYNHNGTLLAVSDSDGLIYIYTRRADKFQKSAQFKGDDAAIWKIAWAHPSYGETIAIGSFKRKVAIFQNRGNNNWVQVANHQIHQGSVNHVEWANIAFGLKLFSAGSDGTVAILQLKKNNWNQLSFAAHECSINSLGLRHLALNQDEQERPNAYPLLATVAKDNTVKLWRHTSQISEDLLDKDARVYQQILSFKPHSETIRALLWKVRWTETEPIQYELFTSSEDGSVKLTFFKNDKLAETIQICRFESAVFRISQSLTGNQLSVSIADEEEHTYLFGEGQNCKEWDQIKQIQ